MHALGYMGHASCTVVVLRNRHETGEISIRHERRSTPRVRSIVFHMLSMPARPTSAAPRRAAPPSSAPRPQTALTPHTEYVQSDGQLPPTVKEAPYLTVNRCVGRSSKLLGELRAELQLIGEDACASIVLVDALEDQLNPMRELQMELRNASTTTSSLWRAEREIARLKGLLEQANVPTHRVAPPPPTNVQQLVAQTGPHAFGASLAELRVLQQRVAAQERELKKRADKIVELEGWGRAHAEMQEGLLQGAKSNGSGSATQFSEP